MNTDLQLKTLAQNEPAATPESFSQRVDETLNTLPRKTRPMASFRRLGLAACAVLAVLIALPNLSPTVANAMGELPVLGSMFQAFTFRTYEVEEGNNHVSIDEPKVSLGDGTSSGAQAINDQVADYTKRLISSFESEMHADGYFDLSMDWSVVTNTENWFTLKVQTLLVMAGASNEIRYYHIDVPTGEARTLSDIFDKEFDYVGVISQELKEQMRGRMDEDPTQFYWLEGTTEMGELQFDTLDPEHNFYFNDEGNLVIPFVKYEVGPGSTGSPEFVLQSPEIYEHLLVQP